MTETTTQIDRSREEPPEDECPDCGGENLEEYNSGAAMCVFCPNCDAEVWPMRVELGG